MAHDHSLGLGRVQIFETCPHLTVIGDKDISKGVVCSHLGRPDVRKPGDNTILKVGIITTQVLFRLTWCRFASKRISFRSQGHGVATFRLVGCIDK